MTTHTKQNATADSLNARRRKRARRVLAAYAEITGQHREDSKTLLCDLLADCMHLLGPDVVDGCALMACEHHQAEEAADQ
jgi:hypothetical protein